MTPASVHTRCRVLERGIRRVQRLLKRGRNRSLFISRGRLAIVVAAFVLCGFLYQMHWHHAGNGVLTASICAFLSVAFYHNRLERRLDRVRLWLEIKSRHVARCQFRWDELPKSAHDCMPDHPYANDLGILGPHSLLHVIDSSISAVGQVRLREWFLNQNECALSERDWKQRQTVVKDLVNRAGLRDRLLLASRLVEEKLFDATKIADWLENAIQFPRLSVMVIIASLLCGTTATLLLWSVVTGGRDLWIIPLGIYATLYFLTAGHLAPVFGRVQTLHMELHKLAAVIDALIQRRAWLPPSVTDLCRPFLTKTVSPVSVVRSLARICHGLSVKAHPLIHLLLNGLLPWDYWWVFRLERVSLRVRHVLPLWIDRLATLDAAASLANFAWINPSYSWPELSWADKDDVPPHLEGKAIGHPLLPAWQRVTNDWSLQGKGTVVLVTGSNMSGKSTFLRTIGINLCLAQAGGPVCAAQFRATWMRIGCCIRVQDSLEAGLSYFYAEVKQLKRLLDALFVSRHAPLLFLIDEIFKGTNNRERLLGSQAYIRALTQGQGLGLITTHDLELAQLESELPQLANVHFQETVEGDRLVFDYRLRPGPCPTTNALRIMKLEGLPVSDVQKTE